MIITAKFDGRCAKCNGPTKRGEDIEYRDKKALHPSCAEEEGADEPPSPEQYELADRLGFRHFSWESLRNVSRAPTDESERDSGDSRGREPLPELPSNDEISINDVRGPQDH